jgi:hypothetical protein
MTIAEIAATSNAQRRERLLSFAMDLASKGKMVADRNDVIRDTIAGFETGDRRRVFRGFSARLVRRRLSSPQPVDAADRDVAYDGNQGLCAALDNGVLDLERAGLAPTNEREWVERATGSEAVAKKFLMSLGVQEPILGTLAAAVIADQPYVRPLRAAMLSTLAAAGMRRLPPPPNGEPVSGVDLTHGLYLAGCDVFVTEDRELQGLARAVADHLAHHPRVARVADIATL